MQTPSPTPGLVVETPAPEPSSAPPVAPSTGDSMTSDQFAQLLDAVHTQTWVIVALGLTLVFIGAVALVRYLR